jgi:hypothetical protein
MTSVVVSNATPFGQMSNTMVENFWAIDQAITRLQAAIASASSGFAGTAGTEYETGSPFGVVQSSTPGAQGAAWAYAVNVLAGNWATFRAVAIASIDAIDNG